MYGEEAAAEEETWHLQGFCSDSLDGLVAVAVVVEQQQHFDGGEDSCFSDIDGSMLEKGFAVVVEEMGRILVDMFVACFGFSVTSRAKLFEEEDEEELISSGL